MLFKNKKHISQCQDENLFDNTIIDLLNVIEKKWYDILYQKEEDFFLVHVFDSWNSMHKAQAHTKGSW